MEFKLQLVRDQTPRASVLECGGSDTPLSKDLETPSARKPKARIARPE
jgi:hypothetical protein